MALTLTDALGVPATLAPAIRLTITGTVPDAIEAGYLFRLEDEVLELKYFGKTEETILGGAATQTVDDRNVWYARRGVDNTAIVSHIATTAVKGVADALLAGTTEVVPAPPFGTEGGGTSDHTALTNREDADQHPASAITYDPTASGLTATEVQAAIDEVAAAGAVPTLAEVLAAGADPGDQAITAAGNAASLQLPSSGDVVLEGNSSAVLRSNAGATTVRGETQVDISAQQGHVEIGAETFVNINAETNVVIDAGGNVTLNPTAALQLGGASVGFFGTTPIARPEIPATPTEQDIADVLVALGLVTQAA